MGTLGKKNTKNQADTTIKVSIETGLQKGVSTKFHFNQVFSVGGNSEQDIFLIDTNMDGEWFRVSFNKPFSIDIYPVSEGLFVENDWIDKGSAVSVKLPCVLLKDRKNADLKIKICSSYIETKKINITDNFLEIFYRPKLSGFSEKIQVVCDNTSLKFSVSLLPIIFLFLNWVWAFPGEGIGQDMVSEQASQNSGQQQQLSLINNLKKDMENVGFRDITISLDSNVLSIRGEATSDLRSLYSKMIEEFEITADTKFLITNYINYNDAEKLKPHKPLAVWYANPRYIIEETGEKLYEGSVSQNGWKLLKINVNNIIFEKLNQQLSVELGK